jgi:hypothetical protein
VTFISPLGESLSDDCPSESNQRRGHPAITALRLPCVAQQSGCPSKLALAACIPRKPPRNSNSRWPTTPTSSPLLSVMGWDLSRQTHIGEVWTVKKQFFSFNHQGLQSHGVRGARKLFTSKLKLPIIGFLSVIARDAIQRISPH